VPHLDVEIVKRSDRVSGFVVFPKRWIVERTIAWLNRLSVNLTQRADEDLSMFAADFAILVAVAIVETRLAHAALHCARSRQHPPAETKWRLKISFGQGFLRRTGTWALPPTSATSSCHSGLFSNSLTIASQYGNNSARRPVALLPHAYI
jgi:hypothetical protein